MAETDFRALCAELTDFLAGLPFGTCEELLIRARAALAADGSAVPEGREPASVVGEPSDEELLATLDKATAAFPPRHPEAKALNAVEYPLALELRKARAVLARWGHQPATPVAGEVGELVAWLRAWALGTMEEGQPATSRSLTRAADLLEQRHPAPVPVTEKLPGDELCWWFEADEDCGYGSSWTLLRIRGSATGYTHWLPATALPLPAGEVKP